MATDAVVVLVSGSVFCAALFSSALAGQSIVRDGRRNNTPNFHFGFISVIPSGLSEALGASGLRAQVAHDLYGTVGARGHGG